MKTRLILVAALLALAGPAQAADVACTLVTDKGDNIAFQKSSERLDGEYATYEKGKIDSITFYLRAGHGVIRLEARKAGKLLATAWVQVATQGQDGGTLNLDVRASSTYSYEAQCENVVGATGN